MPARLTTLSGVLQAVGSRTLVIDRGDLPDRQRLQALRALRTLTRDHGALLSVSRRPDLAALVDADGLHLPSRGTATPDLPTDLRAPFLIGRSCHDLTAIDPHADYLLVSPFAAPLSKKPERPNLGPQGLRTFVARSPIPIVALGGVHADNLKEIRAAGASAFATWGAVFQAQNPAQAARTLLEKWDRSAL